MLDIVALSGGKDSTALAVRLAELYPQKDFTYICTPTNDELPEMLAHWEKLEEILGKEIVRLTAKKDLNGLINEFDALPNFRMRWCTRILKIEPALKFYKENPGSTVYVGLRADEPERKGGIYGNDVEQKYPLREWGWGLDEVWNYLDKKQIQIPRRTDCARCYHQRLPEWWTLWNEHPALFEDAVQQELKTGRTFRTPGRDSFPAPLIDMRKRFEDGDKPRNLTKYQSSVRDRCRACEI